MSEGVQEEKKGGRQKNPTALFIPIFLTVFLILFISFWHAKSLLEQVVGGGLLLRLERSLFLTHFMLLVAGLLMVLTFVRWFLKSDRNCQ